MKQFRQHFCSFAFTNTTTMKVFIQTLVISTLLIFSSCEFLEDSTNDPNIAEGLKEALVVGTDTAVSKLAINDGYLRDEAVKILLPDEVEDKISEFKSLEINAFGLGTIKGTDLYNAGLPVLGISSLQSLEDKLIEGINRAAESGAGEAAPIFVDAITGITIQDANDILFGSDSAATAYLRSNTFNALFNAYEPKIDDAVNQVKIGNKSVETLYADFVNEYNDILNTAVPVGILETQTLGELADIETLSDPDLSAFATREGLDGLFLKIKEEEKNIREDPLARVTSLLQRVFGKLD
jgi:hypothetical protein